MFLEPTPSFSSQSSIQWAVIQLAWQTNLVPVKIADRRMDWRSIVQRTSAVHASSVVVVVVKTILVPVQVFVRMERLIRGKRMTDIGWNRAWRQIQLRVRLVTVTLREIVVEQVGLAIAAANATGRAWRHVTNEALATVTTI